MFDSDNQIIKIHVNNFTEQHFRNLGYDVQNGSTLYIKASELPHGSGLKIDVECFYCHKIFKQAYRRYRSTYPKCCCNDCKTQKMIEKSVEKYGSPCSLRHPDIQAKSCATNMKNLGVQHPFQNKDILLKCRKTQYENNKHNGVMCSSQQKYLAKLFHGELNVPIDMYYCDIVIDNLIIEYDGSGHDMSVKMGYLTIEDFNNRECERERILIDYNYKVFRIICENDKLPEDNKLFIMKHIAELLFQSGYSVVRYNTVDDNIIYY